MILVFSIHKPDFTQSCGRYCLVLQHQINRINAMMEQTNHSTDTLLASFSEKAGNPPEALESAPEGPDHGI